MRSGWRKPPWGWGFEAQLATVFLLALLAAGLAVALVRAAVVRAEESRDWVAHTLEIQAGLQELQALTAVGLRGVRGFLITGEETYLEPLQAAQSRIPAELSRLGGLTARDSQQRRLRELDRLITRQFALADDLIHVARQEGVEAGRQRFATGAAERAGEALLGSIAEMIAQAKRQLQEHEDAAAARERLSQAAVAALAVVVTAILGGAFLLVRHHLAEQKRAEAERDRFFTLSLDLLCVAGTDGRFKRLNPAFTEILGYGLEELLERPFIDFVHPDDRDATLREVEKLAAGEPTLQFENRYRSKNGSWRWLSWRSRPEPGGLIYATARDVTEQKRIEEELRRLNKRLEDRHTALEAANAELEAFSYSVSHDLRQPLRAIDGFSQALLEDHAASLDPEGRSHLERVRAAAQRMGLLIDDMLKLSQVTRAELARQAVDLSTLAREVAAAASGGEAERQVALEIEDGLVVEADPRLVRIALENLLGNAWKFTRDVPEPRIVVGARREGAAAVYFVRDNGAGFDMAYADKLFMPFQRLHSPREFEGTGIGLAIVARIVHRHGGRVWAEGALGRGATVYFTLRPPETGMDRTR